MIKSVLSVPQQRIILLLILLGFASALVRLFPWRLDYNDLAKQAYASYDMVVNGSWLVQNSPDGEIATKPPLVAWMSALIYGLLRHWPLAWHLPSLLASVVILYVFAKHLGKGTAAAFAALVFVWNHFSQNMLYVIRTDMVLAAFVLAATAQIYRHLKEGLRWRARANLVFTLFLIGGLYTKGPVVFVFLLPGVVVCWLLEKRRGAGPVCLPAYWTWLLASGVFLLWIGCAMVLEARFYDQVVMKEFASRFQIHESHSPKPPGKYFLFYIARFFPWSLLLVAGCFLKSVRERIVSSVELRWLLTALISSWIVLELIPSKRPDRLYPIIPVSAFLLGVLFQRFQTSGSPAIFRRNFLIPLASLAVAGQFAYSLTSIYNDYLHQEGALVIFGKEVMEKMQNGERVLYIQKASAFDTGIVLYAESDRILKEAELAEKWKSNVVANVIVNEDGLRLLNEAGLYPVPVLTSDNERSTEQVHYLLQQPAHL